MRDEPTANLDSVTGKAILDLLRRLNSEEQTTFIIASHDHSLIDGADRVIKIVDGFGSFMKSFVVRVNYKISFSALVLFRFYDFSCARDAGRKT